MLCLLYWQGNWQLLYHPQTALARTPSRLGLPFERVRFAADETGKPQLSGWWIPAGGPPERPANLTVLYLHDGNGNLSDTLETLAFFHRQGLAVFAIDYRAYGESALLHSGSHPSEKQFRQDAEWSLSWLTVTRQLNPARIVVAGSGLGSSIAASLAADHNELAGVILDEPNDDPLRPIFSDPRSRLVPAHWLVADHYDLKAATDQIRIPSLWIISPTRKAEAGNALKAYQACASRKSLTWLTGNRTENSDVGDALRRWLDEL